VDAGIDPTPLGGGAARALDQAGLEERQGHLPHPRFLDVDLSLRGGDDLVGHEPEYI